MEDPINYKQKYENLVAGLMAVFLFGSFFAFSYWLKWHNKVSVDEQIHRAEQAQKWAEIEYRKEHHLPDTE